MFGLFVLLYFFTLFLFHLCSFIIKTWALGSRVW